MHAHRYSVTKLAAHRMEGFNEIKFSAKDDRIGCPTDEGKTRNRKISAFIQICHLSFITMQTPHAHITTANSPKINKYINWAPFAQCSKTFAARWERERAEWMRSTRETLMKKLPLKKWYSMKTDTNLKWKCKIKWLRVHWLNELTGWLWECVCVCVCLVRETHWLAFGIAFSASVHWWRCMVYAINIRTEPVKNSLELSVSFYIWRCCLV